MIIKKNITRMILDILHFKILIISNKNKIIYL